MPPTPRTIAERADLWDKGLPVLNTERRWHGIPKGQKIATIDEMLSLAHAIDVLSIHEKTAFYALICSVSKELENRRALVRLDRRQGWRRLLKKAPQATEGATTSAETVLGVQLPIDDATLGTLLDTLLRCGDVFLLEQASDSELGSAWLALQQVQPALISPTVALSEDDIDLALSWASKSVDVDDLLRGRRGYHRHNALTAISWDSDYSDKRLLREIHRCFAARHAELLVAHLLRSWGHTVEDVSQLQTTLPSDPRWHTHDLAVDAMKVDVKNVTVDRRGRQTWARIKQLRTTVRYDAVCTRWLADLRPFLEPGAHVSAEYLGSLYRTELNTFAAMASPPLSMEIAMGLEERGSKYAGWCFALPHEAYREWDTAFDRVVRAIEASGDDRPDLSVPQLVVLHARGAVAALRHQERRLLTEHATLHRITQAVSQFGRAPRVIIAALLNELQFHLRGEVVLSRSLKKDLFPLHHRAPLGVLDPSESVASFLSAILHLVEFPDALAGIVSLRLMSPNWLRGTTTSGEKVTLFTNCMRCAEFPLIRGRDPDCGHGRGRLVCPEGHCCSKP